MPVLGVGRAQEIMLIVKDLFEKEKLNAKVYIDGMVWDVTAIHNAYPRFMNSDVRQSIFYEGHDPFLSPIFKRVGSMKERLQVIEGGPCVILATSGMLVGGPALTYLGELAGNKKNSLIFTCYQGIGSLGSRIQSGEQKFSLDMQGKLREIDLGMELHTLSGFSGHADRNELISYVDKMQPSPRKVIVNHGESSRCLNIASTIHKTFKVETTAPKNLEVIRLK